MAGDFDLSARITADASGLVDAGAQGAAAINQVGAASAAAVSSADALADATARTTEASAQAAAEASRLRVATDAAAEAAYAAAVARNREAAANVATALAAAQAERAATAAAAAERQRVIIANSLGDALEQSKAETLAAAAAVNVASKAANDNAHSSGNARIAQLEFGHVIRASADSFAAGLPPAQIFAEQIGRLSQVAQYAGGSLGSVGTFLGGPWGIAIGLAVTVLAPFVSKLFETADAAKAVETGSTGLSDAQSALGGVFDLVTGKLKNQNASLSAANELLRLNIELTSIKLRTEAAQEKKSSADTFDRAGSQSVGDRLKGAFEGIGQGGVVGALLGGATGTSTGAQNALNITNLVADLRAGKTNQEDVLRAVAKVDFSGLTVSREDIETAIRDGQSSKAKAQIADLIDKSLKDGSVDPALRQEGRTPRAKKPRKPADTDGLVNSVEGDIQSITAAFTEAPTFVEKARVSVAKLDADIEKLSKKQPPNFQSLIDQAKQAQQVIRDNLDKPYRDFVTTQNDSLDVLKLQVAGQTDQAAALKEVQVLQKTMGPLTQDQKDGVLATVEAIRAEQRELEIRNELNQKYLTAIGSIKSAVMDATQAFVRGDLGQFIKTPGKLLDAFQTLEGQKIFDSLFSGVFRDLQDQVNGTSVAKDAATKYAAVVDNVSAETDKARAAFAALKDPLGATSSSLDTLARAASGAATALSGGSAGVPGASDTSLAALLAKGNGVTGPTAANDNGVPSLPGDITVTGHRTSSSDPIVGALQGISGSIASLFTNKANAEAIGKSIGTFAGKGLEGAATGALVAGIGKSLGVNLSSTGASLGGALGGVLGGFKSITSALGPFGAALTPVLSVVGGLIGSLFSHPKYATASITSNSTPATVTGNDSKTQTGATSDSSSVQSAISTIAQQLGGQIGNYSLALGTFNGKYRVNDYATSASLNYNNFNSSSLHDFGSDEAAAVAYAISEAIKQGAVSGLDAAVQKALASSTDTQKALTEALGVKNLETALGGVQGSLNAIFTTEKNSAAERLRLAKTYGLDVVATEKYNDDQRAALVASTLKTAVGSLQDFLTSVATGDLSDGSAADKRAALKTQIAAAQTDANNGVDGAADKLAQLETQLLQTTKDAYGTAGDEYASDKADAVTAVQAVIQSETDRVNQAAGLTQATTDAVNANTDATNESNDLLAQLVTGVGTLNATVLAKLDLSNLSGQADLYSTLRSSSLAA